MDIELRREPIDDPNGHRLVSALLAEERARYGSESLGDTVAEELCAPHGVFLVAYSEGRAVGCGRIRCRGDGVAELKPGYRPVPCDASTPRTHAAAASRSDWEPKRHVEAWICRPSQG